MSKASELDRKVKLYILECVSSEAETRNVVDIIEYIGDRFHSEMGWSINRIGEHATMVSWLQGLALDIAYMNGDIINLAIEWGSLPENATEGEQGKILDNYWRLMAAKTLQLVRQYRVPKVKELSE